MDLDHHVLQSILFQQPYLGPALEEQREDIAGSSSSEESGTTKLQLYPLGRRGRAYQFFGCLRNSSGPRTHHGARRTRRRLGGRRRPRSEDEETQQQDESNLLNEENDNRQQSEPSISTGPNLKLQGCRGAGAGGGSGGGGRLGLTALNLAAVASVVGDCREDNKEGKALCRQPAGLLCGGTAAWKFPGRGSVGRPGGSGGSSNGSTPTNDSEGSGPLPNNSSETESDDFSDHKSEVLLRNGKNNTITNKDNGPNKGGEMMVKKEEDDCPAEKHTTSFGVKDDPSSSSIGGISGDESISNHNEETDDEGDKSRRKNKTEAYIQSLWSCCSSSSSG